MPDLLIVVVLLAAGNATLVVLLCRSHAFAWLRRRVEGTGIGGLLACPFCTSCWTGLCLVLIAGVGEVHHGLLLWWPAVVCMTSGWFTLIVHAYAERHA